MRRRRGETEKVSKGVREYWSKGVKENYTDTPIHRYTDTERHRFPDSKKAGFTILEAMIAVVILAVALLALLRVMPVGIKGSKLAEETTIATMLAQRKIEETRAGTFPAAGTTTGNFTTEGYPNFEYIRDVTIVTPTTYLREVTVSIYWPAGKPAAEQRVVGFTTNVANYNP